MALQDKQYDKATGTDEKNAKEAFKLTQLPIVLPIFSFYREKNVALLKRQNFKDMSSKKS